MAETTKYRSQTDDGLKLTLIKINKIKTADKRKAKLLKHTINKIKTEMKRRKQ